MNSLKESAPPASSVLPEALAQLAAQPRRGLLVLGMHRSGTSALTGMLGRLGCVLPADLMGAGVGNEKGHWESEGAVAANDRILNSAGSTWEDWTRVNPAWYASPLHGAAVQEAREALRTSFGTAPLFVLKDPRICRLVPIWLDAFGAEGVNPAIIIPVRHPGEVAASLELRDGMEHGYAYLLWLRHTLDAEAGTRGRRRVICHFDQLKRNWSTLAARIGEGLDLVWPRQSASTHQDIDNFLAPPDQRGGASPRSADIMPLADRVHTILQRWSEADEDPRDYSELDSIARQFDAATDVFARLILPGSRSLGPGGGHAMREALAHANDALAEARTQANERFSDYENIIGDRDGRLAAVQASEAMLSALLEDRESQVAALQSERDTFSRTVAELQSERDERVHEHVGAAEEAARRLALAESTLRQREEEIAQTRNELDSARETAARLPLLLEQLEQTRVDIFRVAAECQSAQATVARLQRTNRDLQHQLFTETTRKTRLKSAFYRLETQAAAQENAVIQLRADLASEQTENDTLRRTILEVGSQVAQLSEEKVKAERSAAQQAEERSKAEYIIEERHQTEIKQLANRLILSEEMAALAIQRQAWLSHVNALLQKHPRWWALMPRVWRQRQQQSLLMRHGLFDTKMYLELNPDVAEAGVDPVRHFILHGLKEGRELPR